MENNLNIKRNQWVLEISIGHVLDETSNTYAMGPSQIFNRNSSIDVYLLCLFKILIINVDYVNLKLYLHNKIV